MLASKYFLRASLACAAMALMANGAASAGVITTTSFSGTGTASDTGGESQTQTLTSTTTNASVVKRDGQGVSGANITSNLDLLPDGTINFSNFVAGGGISSSGTAQTSIRQVVTNDTGVDQQIGFSSQILAGAIGMWLVNSNTCFIGQVQYCEETDPPPGASDPTTLYNVGSPAYAGLTIKVMADGVVVFDFDISVNLSPQGGGLSSLSTDVEDGSVLNNFGRLGEEDVNMSVFYAWDETDFSLDIGTLGSGDNVILDFVVETAFSSDPECSYETTCLAALSGFGDPIGSGMSTPVGRYSLRSFAVASAMIAPPEITFTPLDVGPPDAVPLPAGALLMLTGLGGFGVARRLSAKRAA
ncbi:VPLPA-CTERM sorting domain-containing protein [Parvularcula sp. LCG005]|uniref:VPLPA-CTERM sorting domain-containing protein n=1 Tax=Parvularcula sp. LCG005 TaxID=3078805 RepID=UPI002943E778|nr:VPLPA-CTERM sorting domain-containing protein [Parvularcula sp. LCG005]WOI52918.1 VPLPA-CTERM sorting domain-containing protein [Parvularcula sp. LCG005]